MASEKNVHAGHRRNVRQKFLASGADAFLPHELLELLLFYAIPMRDTNPTAHYLLERFGTLDKVFSASQKELCAVLGIGKSSAELIRLTAEVFRRAIEESKPDGEGEDNRSLSEYVLSLFENEKEDCTYILLLDNAFRLIECSKIHTGDFSSASFGTRLIVEPALRRRAAMAVLASFHFGRAARASFYEIEATRRFRRTLELVGVRLMEHYLVAGSYCTQLSRQLPDGLRDSIDVERFFRRDGQEEVIS